MEPRHCAVVQSSDDYGKGMDGILMEGIKVRQEVDIERAAK